MTTKTYCPNGNHMLPIYRRISEPGINGHRRSKCPACEREIVVQFIKGSAAQPAPTGFYYLPHFIDEVYA